MVKGQPPFVGALTETKSLVKTRFHFKQRKFREVSLCFINKKLKRACWRERERLRILVKENGRVK